MLASSTSWIPHPTIPGYVPNILPFTSEERLAKYRAHGALCAIFVLQNRQAPPRLSQWVLLALMDPAFNPPFELVQKHEPTIASALEPWFRRPDGTIQSAYLKTSPDGKVTALDMLICDVFNGKKVIFPLARSV